MNHRELVLNTTVIKKNNKFAYVVGMFKPD